MHQANPIVRMSRGLTAVAVTIVVGLQASMVPAFAAVEIQEVESESGVTAWLVEDETIPMIALRFAFEGGTVQDPEDKVGLINLMSTLFDEGAGDLESNEFQEALDNSGAEMSFQASADALYGTMRLLSENKDEAFGLLRDAVVAPRFDQNPVDRMRSQIITGIRADSRDPQRQGQEEFARMLYGDHPYARNSDGTEETLAAIAPDDLRQVHQKLLARSNLHIAVVGDIDAETLKADLDRIFGDLPMQAELADIASVEPRLGEEVLYEFALPQSTLQLVYPGIKRDDPEFFAAYLANHILGGGTFSSRLFTEVREARGLAYGVGSWLQGRDYSESTVISTSTRADRVEEAFEVIESEIGKFVSEGPTEEELAKAKTYVIGAYAINNLDSSSSIASTLLELQRDDLGREYIETRVDEINGVTLDGVRAAAQRLFTDEPSVLVIGPTAQETGTSN